MFALQMSQPIAPCPSAPAFTMQFYHFYVDWNLEPASQDNMVLMRGAACARPNSIVFNGGAPPHEEREAWEDVPVKMNAAHAVRGPRGRGVHSAHGALAVITTQQPG